MRKSNFPLSLKIRDCNSITIELSCISCNSITVMYFVMYHVYEVPAFVKIIFIFRYYIVLQKLRAQSNFLSNESLNLCPRYFLTSLAVTKKHKEI